MNDEYGISKINKVRQLNKKAHYGNRARDP